MSPMLVKIMLVTVGAVFVVTGIFYFVENEKIKSYDKTATQKGRETYERLKSESASFAAGDDFIKAEDGESAEKYLKQALNESLGGYEKSQIEIKLAGSYQLQGKYDEEIDLLKSIAISKDSHNITKAYAVYMIGSLPYFAGKDVTAKIFSGNPYEEFRKNTSLGLSLAKVFEYAISFHPIGPAAMRAAVLYSEELIRLSKKSGGNSDEALILKEKIENLRNMGLKDLPRLKNTRDQEKYVSEVSRLNAAVVGRLSIAGYKTEETPEDLFKKSLEESILSVPLEAAARYHYALFLARKFGERRGDDIRKLLSPFYENIDFTRTATFRYILNDPLGSKKNTLVMAAIDPKFKGVLLKNGWKENDFR